MKKIGVLLTNTGTPDAPTPSAVRRYLREFLSDKRIVKLPRLIWLPILYGFVLTLRPRRSAKLYQRIWTSKGSPMRAIMQELSLSLQNKLAGSYAVQIGMNYGNPSIRHGLQQLRHQQLDKLIVLPLYPQYSDTTTASTMDRVKTALKSWPSPLPEVEIIKEYSSNSVYIRALKNSLLKAWANKNPAQHLLISFHGIPESFIEEGDPYQTQCEQTAKLLASSLQLSNDQWTLCYQSQFGYAKWLKPSTQTLLSELPGRGIKSIDVICPGFAIDCLETLEEIAMSGQEIFHQAGGETLNYVPALNNSDAQIEILADIIHHANGE